MKDLISVIVPAYNIESYVVRCLDSISAQTYPDIEIVVVDDGSMDGTAEVLDIYASVHSNVRVIHKANGGVTSARMCGVKEARGEWIGFVDGDDEIEPEMFQRLIKNAKTYDAQISHCGYQMLFPDGRIHCFHNTGYFAVQDKITALRELLSGTRIEPGLWNKLFHKTLFRSLLHEDPIPTDIKINEDLLMNFRLFSCAENTVFDDWCPYHYMIRQSSATRQKLTPAAVRDPVRVKELILKQVPAELEQEAKRAYLCTCIATCNRIVREKGDAYKGDYWNMRARIQEKTEWLSLLRGKDRLFAVLILWTPWCHKVLYRFYFRHLSKHPYD